MKLRKFASCHPWTTALYFILLLTYTMLLNDPINMFIAFIGSHLLYACCTSFKGFLKHITFSILIICIIALFNPLFVHQGVTILFYMNDNPITLEALLYGIAFGTMIVSVLSLCKVMKSVMTTDKILYIAGSRMPLLGLVISMVLQLIPKFHMQMTTILQTQKTLGIDISKGHWLRRVRIAVMCFSMIITWAFEHGVMCADSMKARGYGAGKRTSFSFYHFELRDVLMCAIFLVSMFLCISGFVTQFSHMYYYPHITFIPDSQLAIFAYCVYAGLFFVPILLEGKEWFLWRYVHAKM